MIYIVSALVVVDFFMHCWTGEKYYWFQFSYQMENLQEIVNSIEQTGHAGAKEFNNVTKEYIVLKDPSSVFCHQACDHFDMIFIVKSFVGNFAERLAIRKTWGVSKVFKLKTIFVLGYLPDMQEFVDMESNKYNDVLQYDKTDSYSNLVYKTIFEISWLAGRHINADYVHVLDDDRLVNTNKLYEFALKNISPLKLEMAGYLWPFSRPVRDLSSKWYLSLQQYPFDFFVPYLQGGAILTNMKVINKIALAFQYTKVIPTEDVYIGIIARLLNIELIHDRRFVPYIPFYTIKPADELSVPDYKTYLVLMSGWRQMNKH